MLVDTVRVELTYSSELPNEGRDNYPIVLVPVMREGLMSFYEWSQPQDGQFLFFVEAELGYCQRASAKVYVTLQRRGSLFKDIRPSVEPSEGIKPSDRCWACLRSLRSRPPTGGSEHTEPYPWSCHPADQP